MKKVSSRSYGLGVVLTLLLMLAVGQARALDVLTFDTKDPGRNEVTSGLGFSLTLVGSNAVPGLDLSLFDVIYIAHPHDESLLWSLGLSKLDLKDFVANGGGLVFGTTAPSFLPPLSLPPVVEGGSLTPTPDVTAVPEPGTFALFGLGAAGLLFLRRRMKSRA